MPSKKSRHAQALTGLGEAVLDALPLGLYVVDEQLRVVAWNRFREQGPIGKPKQRVLGKPLRQSLTAGGYRATEPLLRRILETGVPHEETVESEVGGRLFRIARLPVRQHGAVTHVISKFEDVTAQHALEMRLIANDRLAFLGQLVTGVAQEIANPLANIAGCVEALFELLEGATPKQRREARRFRDLVRREIARCERVVRSLLEQSRKGAVREADVAHVVSGALRLIEKHPAFSRVTLDARVAPGLLAQIDADALMQVVIALSINAARAMRGNGRLTLRATRRGRSIVIDVRDSGPGVPKEARRHLFEPYFTTDPGSGAGLGLPIARSLVRSRGGDLRLLPSRKGAAFRVILCRARAVLARKGGA